MSEKLAALWYRRARRRLHLPAGGPGSATRPDGGHLNIAVYFNREGTPLLHPSYFPKNSDIRNIQSLCWSRVWDTSIWSTLDSHRHEIVAYNAFTRARGLFRPGQTMSMDPWDYPGCWWNRQEREWVDHEPDCVPLLAWKCH